MKRTTKDYFSKLATGVFLLFATVQTLEAQITLPKDYTHNDPADIGTFHGINFKEGGFSALYPIPGTKGKEFWTISDRGVNVDAANANKNIIGGTCKPTYDKIYAFPNYAPKIHRIRVEGTSIKVLQTITMKRPDGTGATGIINPTGFGSTALEVASTDTVLNCANFNSKIAPKDVWGIDSEGLVVDSEGNFWIAEEGGPTIWKLNKNGIVVKRYTPYANLVGAEPQDVAIDTVFKYRKNNRGFEGLSITPNGKIYAIIQSPVLYPNTSVGEASRIHRILEINPLTNETKMFAYLNDGIIGSGSNQIRLKDWKIGDMAAVNDSVFLVLEAGLRGATDRKFIYKVNISQATPVTSGLYSTKTLEALVDEAGLTANNIVPVKKTLFMDLLANGWPSDLEKAEGIAIINDSTIAITNDNDFGQYSIGEVGVATPNGILSHLFTYGLSGSNKLTNYVAPNFSTTYGEEGVSTMSTPYLQASIPNAKFTSILTAGDAIGGYKMAGLGDGLGAYDNDNGTFSLLMNHEMNDAEGVIRAHGQKGAFVSKWIINKSDLSVVSGSDLIQTSKLWNGTSYVTYTNANPAPTAFNRFCAADLPIVSAFYNAKSGLGTQNRIFMNGEESGAEGRAFAHIVTGTEAGTTYELPRLGKFSWENAIACPSSEDKTVVIGLDDATPGQVYVYVGTKTNTGNDIEKAGLANGNLYGVAVTGLTSEISLSVPTANTAFTLANLGNVDALTGATIQTNSVNAGVTAFLRPEDGAWDPSHPEDFYFATTNSFANPSRLWKLHFTDVKNPELGGTITAVLDGTEGQKMLDNLTIDNAGHILLQEDPGNQSYVAKMYSYNTTTDVLTTVGQHDETRFVTGGANFLTQDEESSGIIDVQEILGAGQFLLYDQAHYAIAGEVVQGGQLLSFFNPATADSATVITQQPSNSYTKCENEVIEISIAAQHATKYQWQVESNGVFTNLANNATYANVETNKLSITSSNALNGSRYRCLASRNTGIIETSTATVVTVNSNPIASITGNTSFCEGSSVLLTSSDGSTYEWKEGSTVLSTTTKSFSPSVAGSYSVKVTDGNGCSSISSPKVVTVNPLPTAAITGNSSFCEGSSVLLTSSDASSYEWKNGLTVLSTTTKSFTASMAGSYTVKVTDGNGCSSESSPKVITVNPNPSALVTQSGPITFNLGNSVDLTAPAGTNYSYLWSNGSITQTITVIEAGNYSVVVTDGNNCTSTSTSIAVTTINTAGLNELNIAKNSFTLQPNPSKDASIIRINTSSNEELEIRITDLQGHVILNDKIQANQNSYTLNTSEFTSGMYLVTVYNNQMKHSERLNIIK